MEEEPPVDLTIDAQRFNHVILVDGERGSGKTTALLTALQLLDPARSPPQREHGLPTDLGAIVDTAPVPIRAVLPPLDMRPLPESTNLMMHLIGRLEAHVPKPANRGDREEAGRPWRELVNAVATSWDGNLDARKATLEPELYALELFNSERRRLNLPQRFREFTRSLQRQLYVIAVDDPDMSPGRVAEMLDLVRVLSVPRVAWILAGDSVLFHQELEAHLLGELQSPLRGLAATSESAGDTRSRGIAAKLAVAALDKIAPSSHRARLTKLSRAERRARLADELSRFPLREPLESPKDSLLTLFVLHEQLCDALPHWIRDVTDLAAELRDHIQSAERETRAVEATNEEQLTTVRLRALHRAVHSIWRRQLSTASPEEQRALEPSVVWNPERGRLTLHGRGLTVQFRPPWTRAWPHGIQYPPEWDGLFRATFSHPSGDTTEVRPELLAAILLVNDMLESQGGGETTTAAIVPSGMAAPTGFRYFRLSDEAPAKTRAAMFGWPLPDWRASIDFVRFFRRWSPVLEQPGLEREVGRLAREFLAATVFVSTRPTSWSRNAYRGRERYGDAPLVVDASRWESVAAGVAQLPIFDLARPYPLRFEAADWATRRAPLLAAPESGLPPNEANSWLECWRRALAAHGGAEQLEWDRFAAAARARLDRATASLSTASESSTDGARAELQAIDNAHEEFAWATTVERRQETDIASFRALPVSHEPSSSARAPGTLGDYMDAYTDWAGALSPRERATLRDAAARHRISPMRALFEALRLTVGEELLTTGGWSFRANRVLPGALSVRDTLEGAEISLPGGSAMVNWPSRDLRRVRIEEAEVRGAGRLLAVIAADVVADTYDVDDDEIPFRAVDLPPIPLCDVRLTSFATDVTWPLPHWTTLLDYDCVAASWSTAAQLAAAGRGDVGTNQKLIDALAFHLVQAIIATYKTRSARYPFRVDNEDWHQWIGVAADGTESGLRAHRFRDWLKERLPVYATPESGVSYRSAARLLTALRDAEFSTVELRAARDAWWRDRYGPEAETLMRRVDREFPQHPWIVATRE